MWTLISELVKIWIISHNFKSCPFYVVNFLRNLDNTFWRYCTKFTDSKAMYWFSFYIVPHNLLFQYLPTNHEPCIINVAWYVLARPVTNVTDPTQNADSDPRVKKMRIRKTAKTHKISMQNKQQYTMYTLHCVDALCSGEKKWKMKS